MQNLYRGFRPLCHLNWAKVRTPATASEFASYNLCEDADISAQKYTLAYTVLTTNAIAGELEMCIARETGRDPIATGDALVKSALDIIANLHPLLPKLGMLRLTDLHSTEVITMSVNFRDNAFSQSVRRCVPMVQRWLQRELGNQAEGFNRSCGEMLSRLRVCVTSDISIVHKLHHQRLGTHHRHEQVDVHLKPEEGILHVSSALDSTKTTSHKLVWAEFIKVLQLPAFATDPLLRDMELFHSRLGQQDAAEALNEYPELEDGIEAWLVPEPELFHEAGPGAVLAGFPETDSTAELLVDDVKAPSAASRRNKATTEAQPGGVDCATLLRSLYTEVQLADLGQLPSETWRDFCMLANKYHPVTESHSDLTMACPFTFLHRDRYRS